MFWSKLLKYLTRHLFANIKLLREENSKWFLLGSTNYNQFLAISPNTQEELAKIGQFFQVSIHFNRGHPRPKITNTNSV